jgi:hypothetical protein
MQVSIPAEKSFDLEAKCRQLEKTEDVGKLAAMLLRQNYLQQEYLKAAVNEIARLEVQLMKTLKTESQPDHL